MVLDQKVTRRKLLGMGAGGAALALLAPFAPAALAAPVAGNGKGRLIPAGKVGTITYTQRDVPGRLGVATGTPVMDFWSGRCVIS